MIHTKAIESSNIIRVEVGTNCPKGGDSGHGGETILRLINEAGTDMSVSVNGSPLHEIDSVQLRFGGDTECETLLEALEFAVTVLRAQLLLNGSAKHNHLS